MGVAGSPVKEVRPPSVGIDRGQTLQAAGEVRGERRLADVLQPFQLTNQHPFEPEKKKKNTLEKSHTSPWSHKSHYILSEVILKCDRS